MGNKIIIIGSIVLWIIYLLILIIKSKRIKKIIPKIIILTIILLIVNLIVLKTNKNEENIKVTEATNEVTSTKIKEENTSTESTTTKTTKATTSTTKKITSTTKATTKKTETSDLTGKTIKGFDITYKDGAYYVDGYMIVNKTYSLPSDWIPKNTHEKPGKDTKYCTGCLDNELWESWSLMKSDASAVGINLWDQSGYRSYKAQEGLYNNYVKRDGKTAADTYSARPGHSEHQTGLALDLNDAGSKFNGTKAAEWVSNNCYLYGFIIRYPEGKSDETGYKWESWHIRYVGKDLAQKLYNNGDWITMENYFGLTSKYEN